MIRLFTHILILVSFFVACLPQQNPVLENSTGTLVDNNDEDELIQDPLPQSENVNYFQQGQQTQTSTLTLFDDFNDSFLVRGAQISQALMQYNNLSNQRFCLMTDFSQAKNPNDKPVLLLAARVRSFINYATGQTEYYFAIAPSNKTINQNDCLTIETINKAQSLYASSKIALSLDEICDNCSNSLRSSSLNLISTQAIEIPNISLDNLSLLVVPSLTTNNSQQLSCTQNASCKQQGFNCCLAGQCVNHSSLRPGVDTTSSEYAIALQQILARPELIINYPNFFYICPELVSAISNDENTVDPNQRVVDEFNELKEIYECLNPQFDEFSICTYEVNNAKKLIEDNGGSFHFNALSNPYLDDLNFSGINSSINFNNIHEVIYSNQTLYRQSFETIADEVTFGPTDGSLSMRNDNLINYQSVTISKSLPPNTTNEMLKIRYLIDGSCEKLSDQLARCSKSYTQGQQSLSATNRARPSDHRSGDQLFRLPFYADLTHPVIVEVNDVKVPSGSQTWSLSSNAVIFNSTSYVINDNQRVKLTYFVRNRPGISVTSLTASKELAKQKLYSLCSCDETKGCNLKPQVSESDPNKIINYICNYSQNQESRVPLQEVVYISGKTVAHRFYDESGVYYKNSELALTGPQEGIAFEYDNNNPLKPNNQSQYIGFNEIYGSFDKSQVSAQPAYQVDVEKGVNYEIYSDSGVFSSCLNCGSDYYSQLQKLFPSEFINFGGGYTPNIVESRREENRSPYRSDDLLFGRACFVPATMIPWTHASHSDVQTQRLNRLQAQHFLFANGYHRDWYGFDYGSLIGSFDGVKWFSIGNKRRIQAQSNKLFLAINAYHAELNSNNSFKVVINEQSPTNLSGYVTPINDYITHDTDSTGAQCQRMHYCESDNDCLTQLGYDYVCSNVSDLQTSWPLFDNNANELSGSNSRTLLSLVGGSNGQIKRCVYRGGGAPCEINTNSASSYTESSQSRLNYCSSNNYCAELSTNVFNDRITKYGDSPRNQNTRSFIAEDSDLFGLGARLLGRPFDFYGNSSTPANVITQLNGNSVESICVPGRDSDSKSNLAELNSTPTNRYADIVNNIGRTKSGLLADIDYYGACPAVTDNFEAPLTNTKNSIDFENPSDLLNDDSTLAHALKTAQNISTNLLSIPPIRDNVSQLFNDQDSNGLINRIGITQNSCLRTPGASCFADYDCAPNRFIASKISTLLDLDNDLNSSEVSFWKSDLTCGYGEDLRYLDGSTNPNPNYDIKNHKCCRETSKKFIFETQLHDYSQKIPSDPDQYVQNIVDAFPSTGYQMAIPGVTMLIDNPRRNSTQVSVYDLFKQDPAKYPALFAAGSVSTGTRLPIRSDMLRQYNTLHAHNTRMCCTGHWVREFNSDSNGNGGGHQFTRITQQNLTGAMIKQFRQLSWAPESSGVEEVPPEDSGVEEVPPEDSGGTSSTPFLCEDESEAQTAACEIRGADPNSGHDKAFLEYFAKFELVGIPQVYIETNTTFFKPLGPQQDDNSGAKEAFLFLPSGTITHDATLDPGVTKLDPSSLYTGLDDDTTTPEQVISAASYDKLNIKSGPLKKVFSEKEFSCCKPTGIIVSDDTTNNDCCTGQVSGEAGERRCCLNDYTDVTVFTNRYVSSEGANFPGITIADSAIDPRTGYIEKEYVRQLAANMCCSGVFMEGKAISRLMAPISGSSNNDILGDPNNTFLRWVYLRGLDSASEVGNAYGLLESGVKWNQHIYCVPESVGAANAGGGATAQ